MNPLHHSLLTKSNFLFSIKDIQRALTSTYQPFDLSTFLARLHSYAVPPMVNIRFKNQYYVADHFNS